MLQNIATNLKNKLKLSLMQHHNSHVFRSQLSGMQWYKLNFVQHLSLAHQQHCCCSDTVCVCQSFSNKSNLAAKCLHYTCLHNNMTVQCKLLLAQPIRRALVLVPLCRPFVCLVSRAVLSMIAIQIASIPAQIFYANYCKQQCVGKTASTQW